MVRNSMSRTGSIVVSVLVTGMMIALGFVFSGQATAAPSGLCPSGQSSLAVFQWDGSTFVSEVAQTEYSIDGTQYSGMFLVGASSKDVSTVIMQGGGDTVLKTYDYPVKGGYYDNTDLGGENGQPMYPIQSIELCGISATPTTPPQPTPTVTPTPSPEPTVTPTPVPSVQEVKAKVKFVDKPGRSKDKYYLFRKAGVKYKVDGRNAKTNVWLKAKKPKLIVKAVAASSNYELNGKSRWVLRFAG